MPRDTAKKSRPGSGKPKKGRGEKKLLRVTGGIVLFEDAFSPEIEALPLSPGEYIRLGGVLEAPPKGGK